MEKDGATQVSVDPPKALTERQLAEMGLRKMAESMNDALSPFITWLVGGTGAALSVLVINLEKVGPVVGQNKVRTALFLLTAALLAGAIAKLFSALTAGLVTLYGEDLSKYKRVPDFQAETYLDQVQQGLGPVLGRAFRAKRRATGSRRPRSAMGFVLLTIVVMFLQIGFVMFAINAIAGGLL